MAFRVLKETSPGQVDAKVGPPRGFRSTMNQEITPFLLHLAAALFGIALLHTFCAIVLVLCLDLFGSGNLALSYAESRQYAEPLFVFVVMVVAASRPVLVGVMRFAAVLVRLLPVPEGIANAWLGLALIPLAGSLITEPAAMTLGALMLAPQIFRTSLPEPPKYFALGVLFVNISIGGTLTSFAA